MIFICSPSTATVWLCLAELSKIFRRYKVDQSVDLDQVKQSVKCTYCTAYEIENKE